MRTFGSIAGKLKASLAPVGAAVASSLYMSQAGFFAGLWYSVFGVPAWVGAVGAAVGAGVAFVIAPILGGVVEYGLNQRSSLETRMRDQLDAVRDRLLNGHHDGALHTESVLTDLLRQREIALDLLRCVRGAIRA